MIAFNEITSLYVSQTGCDNQSGSEPVSCSTGAPFSSILGDEYVALLDAEARAG